MAEVKWIKIVTDIFDDEKILLIESLPEADSIIVIWFKLLCLAGKQNNSGVFVMSNGLAYTDKMLATIFRRKESTINLALRTFEEFGMIEIINDAITIPNWSKHQTLDQLEERKEYMREYMKKYREKQKLLTDGESKTNSKVYNKVNVNSLDKDIEKEKDKDNKNKRFIKPTLEDVQEYCQQRNNNINPEHFIDYYEANGWKVGKNPMKDWKAAIRTWEKRDYETNPKQSGKKEIVPEWMDKKIEKKPLSPEAQAKLDKLLEEFK